MVRWREGKVSEGSGGKAHTSEIVTVASPLAPLCEKQRSSQNPAGVCAPYQHFLSEAVSSELFTVVYLLRKISFFLRKHHHLFLENHSLET